MTGQHICAAFPQVNLSVLRFRALLTARSCTQVPQQLQLALQPDCEGVCRLRLACNAAHRVQRTFVCAYVFYRQRPPSLKVPSEKHSKRMYDCVHHNVANCLGPRLVHVLARVANLYPLVECAWVCMTEWSRDADPSVYQAVCAAADKLDNLHRGCLENPTLKKIQADLEVVPRHVRLQLPCSACSVQGADRAACTPATGLRNVCTTAADTWAAHHQQFEDVSEEAQEAEPKKLLARAEALCATVQQAHEELRAAVLQHMMRRLVSQHLRAIKERLWRPEGRLVQRRAARLRAAEGGHSRADPD